MFHIKMINGRCGI